MLSSNEPRNKLLAARQTQLPPYPDDLNVRFERSAVAPSPLTPEAKNSMTADFAHRRRRRSSRPGELAFSN